uniref:Bestrophin homolog n=1 Tax=Strongyloides stercoralis TaxID=6248 RepID=A0A0K0EB85_STRER
MTIPYACDVASSDKIGMLKILFKWNGSIWKSVILELFVFIIAYAGVAVVIREILTDTQRIKFVEIRSQLSECLQRIPLVFLLGFFVSVVFNRWIDMFKKIGFIDNIALILACHIPSNSHEVHQRKRNIIRYCVLSQALVFRDISIQVKKRLPTDESLIDSGLMTQQEYSIYKKEEDNPKYWMPIQWAMAVCYDLRYKHDIIKSDPILLNIVDRIRDFRTDLQGLLCYDWVPVPLSYPQIVYLVVRVYFAISVFARQGVERDRIDHYVPFMTILEFLFITGWVKVAEALLNPFGEDDDDFETFWFLERNLSKGLEIVKCTDYPKDDQADVFSEAKLAKPFPVRTKYHPKRDIHPYKGSAAMLKLEQTAKEMKNIATGSLFCHDNKISPLETHLKDSINRIRKMSSSIVEMNIQDLHNLESHSELQSPTIIKRNSLKVSENNSTSPTLDIPKESNNYQILSLSTVTKNQSSKDINGETFDVQEKNLAQ